MTRTDSIRITRTEEMHPGYPIDLTEEEFRKLFANTLAAVAAFGQVSPEIAKAMNAVAEYIDGDDPIGDEEYDYSLLGTFQTVNQII